MTTRHVRYCRCGAKVDVRSRPPALADEIAAMFVREHTGDGHGDATAAQASAARRREERKLIDEMKEH